MAKLKISALFFAMALVAAGCAASNSPPPAAVKPAGSDASQATPALFYNSDLNQSRLDQLWESRRADPGDFPIGTGDIISVSVPGLTDFDNSHPGGEAMAATGEGVQAGPATGATVLDNWTVRVGSEGNINLPLLGGIHVAGLTEQQLRDELKGRLEKYMYDPQVEIFVKSYNSRQVAVSGEIRAPGIYVLTGPNETIRDLLMKAGGTTEAGAARIILTPAPANGQDQHASNLRVSNRQPSESVPQALPQADGAGSTLLDSDTNALSSSDASETGINNSYVIDLTQGQSHQRYLNIPARPGDTIYVPRSGSATVIGWVYTPKTIPVRPGLTVLSAVSEAGGTLYAADANNVKVIRQAPGEETKTLVVNLNDIKAARAPDVLVQANDVIDVSYSTARIPGYAVYYALQGLVQFAPAALIVGGVP